MLQYGLDILNSALFRARQLQAVKETDTSFYENMMELIGRAYLDILREQPWPFAMKDPPGTLDVVAKVTGTATITQATTAVTLGSTISTSMAGRWFQIDAEDVLYRVSAHTAGTAAITLDASYKEDSVSAGPFTIFKDEYSLASDCLRIWGAKNRNDPRGTVEIVDPNYMHAELPDRGSYSSNAGGQNLSQITLTIIQGGKVRISPWPDTDSITIEYSYSVKPTSNFSFDKTSADTPLVPLEYRHVISDKAVALLLAELGDPRVTSFDALAKRGIDAMIQDYIATSPAKSYIKRGAGIFGGTMRRLGR